MVIRSCNLETVCGPTSTLPKNDLPEVAFAGKSNVGKSSLINAVMNRKSLARVSAQPGKTQTINFYNINDEIYVVDLPGYGFAKASEKERERWGKMIETYLNTSDMIRAVFLLVDIRHAPSANDKQMFEWMDYVGYDPIVIATKADKIKRSQLDKQIKILREGLDATKDTIIVPFSSQTKQGLDTIQDFLAQVIENEASLSDVEDLD
ncbi:ribosome biogenesis GTP-binding protein YihA/YsxC [Pseudobutyrivibrio ruminis]|uniref:Probable GTP-binding protein EngB n=1 Tax=Pseudobutyrivibrio ruminis TaxID=46206 RepID=A0A2G3DTD2_9FIRM|nr:ribosome biogenesis GTP-binding protein YihA/YsxC [Pseudobutyrivibrio ruminis]PHU34282.1 YihA family ribosome biogenesis GTP-binding protein [Pseudobutyrivibrio ruminis]